MRAVKNNLPAPSGEVGESEGPAGLMARLGVPAGGWARLLRAVWIIPATSHKEIVTAALRNSLSSILRLF